MMQRKPPLYVIDGIGCPDKILLRLHGHKEWCRLIEGVTDVVQVEREPHQDKTVLPQQHRRVARPEIEMLEQIAKIRQPYTHDDEAGEVAASIVHAAADGKSYVFLPPVRREAADR